MKPLELKMQAFGPFAGRETVDFERLGERKLFLIHGDTGSGKSTILDGITVALYGEPSYEGRSSRGLRSHLADPDTPTEVELVFAVGSEKYRVKRKPVQERPKRRGSGKVLDQAEAELYRLGDTESVIVTGASMVTEKIVSILGMEIDQFRQVILIPQGHFRQLLTVKSSDRQRILQILFGTERYRRIEERLRDETRTQRIELEKIGSERTIILEQAEVESVAELEAAYTKIDGRLVAMQCEVTETERIMTIARQALAEATAISDLFDEHDRSNQELARLVELSDETDSWRRELSNARRAARVADIDNRFRELESQSEKASKRRCETKQGLDRAMSAAAKAEKQLHKANLESVQLDEAVREKLRLESLIERSESLDEATGEFSRAELVMRSISEEQSKVVEARSAVTVKIGALESHLGALKLESARIEYLEKEAESASETFEAGRKLEALSSQSKVIRERRNHARKILDGQLSELTEIEAGLEDMIHRRDRTRAAIMAAELTPGAPCPVCGSTEHPKLARSDLAIPSDHEIEDLRERSRQTKLLIDESRSRFETDGIELTASETSRRELMDRLGEKAVMSPEALEIESSKERDKLESARDAGKAIRSSSKELGQLKERLAETESKITEIGKAFGKARETLAAVERARDERAAGLPLELREVGAITEAIGKVARKIDDLEAGSKAARAAMEKSSNDLASAKASFDEASMNADKVVSRLRKLEEDLQVALVESSFDSRDSYLAAHRTDEQLEALDGALRSRLEQLRSAEDRLARSKERTAGMTRPDLEALRRSEAGATKSWSELLEVRSSETEQSKRIGKWLGRLEELDADFREKERLYGVSAELAEIVGGRRGRGISLERFILGTRLDEVGIAANHRLRLMSRGRYELYRAEDRTDKRSAGGLDLDVFDSYTGTSRPAATLSGGESFQAALSLALGLADVVQAYAGGIRMETVFIDEGFGTLDQEALDWALSTLVDLQGQGRIVGVISHIPELKERIDVRLEVLTSQGGSHTRMIS